MHIGIFTFVAMAAALGLVPGWVWDRLPPARLPAWLRRLPRGAWSPPWRWEGPLALALSFYVLWWNLASLEGARVVLPDRLRLPGRLLQLDQRWSMFSPFPLLEDGWYVVEGTLSNGKKVDLFAGGKPVSWEKPACVSHTYPNDRWRKYLMNLYLSVHQVHRPYYLAYLCRSWNERHRGPWRVERADMVFMLETTPPPGTPGTEPRKIVTWSYLCPLERGGFAW
jgi:hypothetical protein